MQPWPRRGRTRVGMPLHAEISMGMWAARGSEAGTGADDWEKNVEWRAQRRCAGMGGGGGHHQLLTVCMSRREDHSPVYSRAAPFVEVPPRYKVRRRIPELRGFTAEAVPLWWDAAFIVRATHSALPSHTHDCKNVYRRMVSPPHGGAARRSRLSAPRSKGDFYRACQVCGSTSDSGQRADARGAARTSRPILLIRGADAVGVQYVRLYYTGNVTDCNQPDCAKSAKHMHKTATTCFCTQVSLRVCCAAAADARVAGIHRQTSRTKLHADEV